MPNISISAPNVPLVGQPIRVLGYTVVASAQCQCSPGDPLQVLVHLDGGSHQAHRAVCPRCQNAYSVQMMGVNDHGHLGFGFAIESPAVT